MKHIDYIRLTKFPRSETLMMEIETYNAENIPTKEVITINTLNKGSDPFGDASALRGLTKLVQVFCNFKEGK